MAKGGKILTPREMEVLELVSQGYLNKMIGDKLNISAQTVKNHVRAVLRKLGAYNRAHAVALAKDRGIL